MHESFIRNYNAFDMNSSRRQFELGMAFVALAIILCTHWNICYLGLTVIICEKQKQGEKIWNWWINECLKHGQNINILCTKLGWPSWAQLIKPICIHEDVNFQWKTGRDANKFWEKEIILYRFLLRDLCCPQSNPSWKDNYFPLWFIFEDCLS